MTVLDFLVLAALFALILIHIMKLKDELIHELTHLISIVKEIKTNSKHQNYEEGYCAYIDGNGSPQEITPKPIEPK